MRNAVCLSALLLLVAGSPEAAEPIQWGNDPSQQQGWRPSPKPAAAAPQVTPGAKTQLAPPSKVGPKTISTPQLTLFGTNTGPVTLLTPPLSLVGTHGGPTSITTAALKLVGTHGGPVTLSTPALTLVGTHGGPVTIATGQLTLVGNETAVLKPATGSVQSGDRSADRKEGARVT